MREMDISAPPNSRGGDIARRELCVATGPPPTHPPPLICERGGLARLGVSRASAPARLRLTHRPPRTFGLARARKAINRTAPLVGAAMIFYAFSRAPSMFRTLCGKSQAVTSPCCDLAIGVKRTRRPLTGGEISPALIRFRNARRTRAPFSGPGAIFCLARRVAVLWKGATLPRKRGDTH